ncbi:hypothetical protein TNCV_2589571 [Trichonephila clavipes]|nr:hypothetical protein TNCV_2589571 [Trichonephila clavipes]
MGEELWPRVEALKASVPVHVIQSLFESILRRISDVNTARATCNSSSVQGGRVELQMMDKFRWNYKCLIGFTSNGFGSQERTSNVPEDSSNHSLTNQTLKYGALPCWSISSFDMNTVA